MEGSILHREAVSEPTLEALVSRRAREIAEEAMREVASNYLQTLQVLLDRMKAAAAVGTLPAPAEEYLTIGQAAKRYGTHENAIRRAVGFRQLTATKRPSMNRHRKGLVMTVPVADLDRWAAGQGLTRR